MTRLLSGQARQATSWPHDFQKIRRALCCSSKPVRTNVHGSNGPLPVRRHQPDVWQPTHAAFYQACLEVVDQSCRVHGLRGLRVVDASVMPDVVRANTNAATIMIAERIADWIKEGK